VSTLSRREMLREARRVRKAGEWDLEALPSAHPRTRGECAEGQRPCPLVGCRYHLYLDVDPSNGSIKLNRPDLEVWDLERSCALDEAERDWGPDRYGMTLEEIAEVLGVTRERVRQLETAALRRLRELVGDDPEASDADVQSTFARTRPLKQDDVLNALGLKKEDSWLRNLLNSHLSTNLDEEHWLTSMTDSA
jgi:hypothetical protein